MSFVQVNTRLALLNFLVALEGSPAHLIFTKNTLRASHSVSFVQVSTEKAAPDKAGPGKAGPGKAGPDKVGPANVGTEKAAPGRIFLMVVRISPLGK